MPINLKLTDKDFLHIERQSIRAIHALDEPIDFQRISGVSAVIEVSSSPEALTDQSTASWNTEMPFALQSEVASINVRISEEEMLKLHEDEIRWRQLAGLLIKTGATTFESTMRNTCLTQTVILIGTICDRERADVGDSY